MHDSRKKRTCPPSVLDSDQHRYPEAECQKVVAGMCAWQLLAAARTSSLHHAQWELLSRLAKPVNGGVPEQTRQCWQGRQAAVNKLQDTLAKSE